MTDTSTDLRRASDAERQFVVDRLRDETAAGRMSIEEFDRRAGRVYTARTRDQLLALLPGTDEPGEATEAADEISVTLPAPQPRRWRWRR